MDAYGKSVEAVCSGISLGMQFHRFLSRDIFSWSCMKAVVIKPRLSDLKVASLLCLLPFLFTLNLTQTCDDTNWNSTVFCLVDVHQKFFCLFVCQSILGQGRYFSKAALLILIAVKG